mmetsp:Transcript_69356/g.137542  ORF Transcript_69356/g.137542 Transcript_69356/m.137542 type:complete len:96 (+) Transcript_69356:380-667(+)
MPSLPGDAYPPHAHLTGACTRASHLISLHPPQLSAHDPTRKRTNLGHGHRLASQACRSVRPPLEMRSRDAISRSCDLEMQSASKLLEVHVLCWCT